MKYGIRLYTVKFRKGSYSEQKLAFREMDIRNPLVELGYIDIDTQEDPTYLNLLLHSDLVEVIDGTYKIKTRHFRAMNPCALWIARLITKEAMEKSIR